MITYITINTHEEILVIMATPEWTDPNPPE